MNAREVIHFLSLKSWSIQRTIFDRHLGFMSSFEGRGNFISHDSSWIYDERGELLSHGRTYSASRRYIYELQSDFLSVNFEDGRPFYSIDCGQLPEVSFEHLCGLDRYVGNLVLGYRSWENSWRVVGPSKDLEIFSNYF